MYGCKSVGWNDSGSLNHFACLLKSSVNTASMSITVALPIRSMARVEYSAGELANNRKRPRLSIGAADASAACLSKSRRVIFIVRENLVRQDSQDLQNF